jgi:hypothetical protein
VPVGLDLNLELIVLPLAKVNSSKNSQVVPANFIGPAQGKTALKNVVKTP